MSYTIPARVRFPRDTDTGTVPVSMTPGSFVTNEPDRKLYFGDQNGNPILISQMLEEHDPGLAYKLDDLCIYQREVWRATVDNGPAAFSTDDWENVSSSGNAGIAAAFIGPNSPPDPKVGWLWWKTTDPVALYVYHDDGSSVQWVQANGVDFDPGDYVAITGDTMTGPLSLPPATEPDHAVRLDQVEGIAEDYVAITGDIMEGPLAIATDDDVPLILKTTDGSGSLSFVMEGAVGSLPLASLQAFPATNRVALRAYTTDGEASTGLLFDGITGDIRTEYNFSKDNITDARSLINVERGDERYVLSTEYPKREVVHGPLSYEINGDVLECWGVATTSAITGDVTVSFPKRFKSAPAVIATAAGWKAGISTSPSNDPQGSIILVSDIVGAGEIHWRAKGQWNGT